MVFKFIERASVVDRGLEVHFEEGMSIKFEDCWLRDHCRCTSCYNAETHQRVNHILDIPNVSILRMNHNETKVFLTWSDNHESRYSYEFLSKFKYEDWQERRQLRPLLWHGNISDKITRIQVDNFLNSVDGAKSVFQSLLDYGVALIDGVGLSVKDTKAVCKALGGVQHTLFGGMWKFSTKADHADTAYTNLPLAVHNDNTYFTEAAGLQVLHCLEHKDGDGGETILVDGFHGAQQLKKEHQEDFNFLTKFNVEAEYIEDGHHHRFSAPVIKLNTDFQNMVQIRFNVYDRAPMAFDSSENCRSYYRSLRNLAKYYESESNQWKFKLQPGTLMVMDNFRVLHGRTGFSGIRVLAGSYVGRSDWLDRARTLNLIE